MLVNHCPGPQKLSGTRRLLFTIGDTLFYFRLLVQISILMDVVFMGMSQEEEEKKGNRNALILCFLYIHSIMYCALL